MPGRRWLDQLVYGESSERYTSAGLQKAFYFVETRELKTYPAINQDRLAKPSQSGNSVKKNHVVMWFRRNSKTIIIFSNIKN
jgi:hypothetical protein